jgi:hypothetical protein
MHDHVIITGNYTPESLYKFLLEFYHSDHGSVTTSALIIGEDFPSRELM